MSKWSQPMQVSALEAAVPATVQHLMPAYEDIPDEFKGFHGEWPDYVEGIFYQGGTFPAVREGIDRAAAILHFRAVLRSFEPKHEHKIAACAYLLSLWCDSPPEAKP